MAVAWVTLALCLASVSAFSLHERNRRQAGCEFSSWTVNGNHEYSASDKREDFATAEAKCEACGASLASVESAEENDYIRSLYPAGDSVYIGYTDQFAEGNWVWVDGSSSQYTNWRGHISKGGEPDNVDTDGVTLNADCAYLTNTGAWRDLACNSKRVFVCKKDAIVLTTTPAPVVDVVYTTLPAPVAEVVSTTPPAPFVDVVYTTLPAPVVDVVSTNPPALFVAETPAPEKAAVEVPTPETTTVDSGYRRTVVLLEKPTVVGQNVFFRGGLDHSGTVGCTNDASTSKCAIPITYRDLSPLSEQYRLLFNAWRQNDRFLDWYGAESEQGTYNGRQSEGTPAVWTTNAQSDNGYYPINTFGAHYWLMDVDMDCRKTNAGYFDIKGFLSGAWEPGNNHKAKCGALNVFHWGQDASEVKDIA